MMARGMSDKTLAAKAREYKHHASQRDSLAAELLAELQRREVSIGEKLEVLGVRLRHKQWRKRRYSIERIKQQFRPKHRKAVVVEHVDLAALDELLRTHEISDADANACFEGYDEGAEYVDVQLLTST